MKTLKQIEQMAYGSPEQMREADKWYKKFVSFEEKNPFLVTDKVWNRVHKEVGYQARRRFFNW